MSNPDRLHLEAILSKRTRGELVQLAKVFGVPASKKHVLVQTLCDRIEQHQQQQQQRTVLRGTQASWRYVAFAGVLLVVLFFVSFRLGTKAGAFTPGLVACYNTNASSHLVRRLVSAAKQAANGHFSAGAPHSLVFYKTMAEEAKEQLEGFARLRFQSPDCAIGRVILTGHQLDECSILKQLRTFPDSLILVDWTKGITNLEVMKRVLDSRCALENCQDVTRDASVFLIVTSLSESEFLAQKGGIDIIARTTEKSLL